ncbi:hypothetical protein NL462_27745, partial [Klebsiella pneumoniae]|nr:hypothetical protein [Klebsiella pneumoniae]
LRDRITASQMLVCADDKGHVVARDVHAYRDGDASFTDAIYTGSRKALHRVQNTGRYPLDFVEPRYLRTGATGSQRF